VAQRDVVDDAVRRFTDNGCQVTSVVADPADAQQVLYGTVTRDGKLIGSYYCTDGALQFTWHVVTADGDHLCADGVPLAIDFEGHAVYALTTLTEESRREATQPPDDNVTSPGQ
jgi:hypothetical protein